MKLHRISFALVAGGTVLFGLLLYFILASRQDVESRAPYVTVSKEANPQVASEINTAGLPVRLIVPKVAIDTNVLYMGLTDEGDMDVPENNFKDVGWYQYGARPGDVGTAVVAGHVNGKNERGVFIDLHKMKVGDTFKTLDDKNQTASFTVRDIRSYDQDDRPDEVFDSGEGAHLNLITCAGQWDAAEQQFPTRLVVFADKTEGL